MMSDDADFNTTAVKDMICTALADESSSSAVKYSHPTIESLDCIGSAADGVADNGLSDAGGAEPTFQPVAQQFGASSYLVTAAAAIVVVLGIYGYRRRHHHTKEEKVEVGPLDDSDLVNMSNSLSFEGTGPYNGTPALDFTPITVNPTYTAQGIEGMARQSSMTRQSYFPVSEIVKLSMFQKKFILSFLTKSFLLTFY